MSVLTSNGTMLYCPKCEKKYEVGSRRFCDNDGGRLLPAPSEEIENSVQNKAVFTSLLGRGRKSRSDEHDEKLSSRPRFVKVAKKQEAFEPKVSNNVFKTEKKINTAIKTDAVRDIVKTPPAKDLESDELLDITKPNKIGKPSARLMRPDETFSSRSNVSVAEHLTYENTDSIIGQTIKGRYQIVERLSQDQTSVAYLAKDGIGEGNTVVVRILLRETSNDDVANKLFLEESVSLSHINHPNVLRVVDSGILPEGKPFVISEYDEGVSVEEILTKDGALNPLRTARVIRQASRALGEMHQNGILHRNLKPEHIVLRVSEVGIEQAKVADFCVSDGTPTEDNLQYKAPEQLGRQLPTFASDSYSLAVIAYRMLTGELPFSGSSEKDLLRAQKAELQRKPSDIKPELSEIADSILEKALSYKPEDRYANVRDFGEAFFNVLTTKIPTKEPKEPEENGDRDALTMNSSNILSDLSVSADVAAKDETETDQGIAVNTEDEVEDDVRDGDTHLWKRRSPDAKDEGSPVLRVVAVVATLLILAVAIFLVVNFFNNSRNQSEPENTDIASQNQVQKTIQDNIDNSESPKDEIEVPPPARDIEAPAGFKYFENSKQGLNKELAKNYRGFSVYYPETWVKSEAGKVFLDVKKQTKDGLPVEQILITHYESKGTRDLDKENFPKLVAQSNKDLKALPIPNYKMVSEGNILVNNGWKGYEVKFRGSGIANNGEKLVLWGRRIWIPAARPGVKNGFVITMIATSLSDKVEGVEDVGVKGELSEILETFEPDRNY